MARILLGVSGGIAAYKALELVRLATAAGHAVRVVQTPTSRRFVGEGLEHDLAEARRERLTRAPEMMQPSETSESVACPTRPSSTLAKTNFAGAAVYEGAV